MPLNALLRALFSLFSLLILGVALYLLWSGYEGNLVRTSDGDLYRVRDEWRLWSGGALLAWSFLGRLIVVPLLARPDKGERSIPERGDGRLMSGAAGSDVYVEEHGRAGAPTLILTHGWGLDSTIWRLTRKALERDYRLIVWDLPGLGRSTATGRNAISLETFAVDLARLIEESGPDRVFLVGHSIGGMTIQTLARDQPRFFAERVAAVALLNTTYTNPLRTMILSGLVTALRRPLIEPMMHLTIWLQPLAWLSAWQSYLSGSAHMANRFGFGSDVTRSQLEHTTLLATRNSPAAQAKGNLAMMHWDATHALGGVPTPTIVVGGDIDIVTKLEASETIAAEARSARLQVVAGANHMGFLEQGGAYHAAIAAMARG